MEREIQVEYSPEIIKFAAGKFWRRMIGLRNFVIFAVVCAAFVLIFLSGDRSWFLGFPGAAIVFCLGFGCLRYFNYLRRSMDKFNLMETPTANFRFTDKRIGIKSDFGWTELAWKMIEEIWQYPSVWLVLIAGQGPITLPTANLDDELKQFITGKAA